MKKTTISATQHITITGWMRNISEIETNNELIAYALIYGFSQTEGQYLTCKQSYIAAWLGITRHRCSELLKRMECKKLIGKKLVRKRGAISQYKYFCILPSDSDDNEYRNGTRDEYRNGTRTSTVTEHVYNTSNNKHIYNYNNNIYNTRVRARESKKQGNQFNRFMQHQDCDYDYQQLELDLLANNPDTENE